MNKYNNIKITYRVALIALLSINTLLNAEKKPRGENIMMVSGEFDVKLTPQLDDDFDSGRMTIEKQYHGELEATGRGQMLSVRTEIQGSAGYVAIERVTGKLKGKSGSFVLQHSAVMNRGASQLKVTVVPDSGAGELVGLSGKMEINISEGKHIYKFNYKFDNAPKE